MAINLSNWIRELSEMNPADVDQIFMQKARESKNLKFEYIDHLDEYFLISRYRKALERVVQNYILTKNNLYESYCKLVSEYHNTDSDLELLLTVKVCEQCAEHYSRDIEVISGMLEEFRYYIGSGHFIDTIIKNETRSISDYWDHRYFKSEDPTDE